MDMPEFKEIRNYSEVDDLRKDFEDIATDKKHGGGAQGRNFNK